MEFTLAPKDFMNNTSAYTSIVANIFSALPLDDGEWDGNRIDEFFQNIASNIINNVTELLKQYHHTAQKTVYNEETGEDDEVNVEIDIDDFELEVEYTDNGYYGAKIEITVYNVDEDNFVDWEHDNIINWLMNMLNEDDEIINIAINDAVSDAMCEGIITFED